MEVVQNATTVMLVPIRKTVSVSSGLLKFYEPINSQGKPAVGREVWSYLKRFKSEI